MNAILDRQDIRVEALRIGGEKVHTPRTIAVRNPYTGETVGAVAMATLEDVRRAYEIAHAYVPRLSRYERSAILNRAALLLRARTDEASTLITSESGLSKKDSIYEIGRVADVLNFGANEALRDDGQVFSCDLTPHGKQRKVITTREPLLGVITAITPFNHPMNQVAHKVVPSVATNNRMVLKPSEKVPLSALYFADLLYEAGLPPEMLQVITGDPREIADEMLTHRHVELITFTGGVEIGKYIANKAGYRRIVLELGGNDPLIVMDDADLDKAVDLAIKGGLSLSGQACTGTSRVLVMKAVKAAFTDKLVARVKALKIGSGMTPGMDLGPLATRKQLETVLGYIEIGKSEAQLLCGGEQLTEGDYAHGFYVAPAVFTGVTQRMRIAREEIFGPVLALIEVDSYEDAIAQANDTEYGLSAAIATTSARHAHRFAHDIQAGTVKINRTTTGNLDNAPFGGP